MSHHVQTDRTDRALMKPLNAKQEAMVSISLEDESSPLKPKSCSRSCSCNICSVWIIKLFEWTIAQLNYWIRIRISCDLKNYADWTKTESNNCCGVILFSFQGKNQGILSKTENKTWSFWSSPTQKFILKTLAYVTLSSQQAVPSWSWVSEKKASYVICKGYKKIKPNWCTSMFLNSFLNTFSDSMGQTDND